MKRYSVFDCKGTFLLFLLLFLTVSFSLIQPVTVARLPDDPADYDSDWNYPNLNIAKLKLRLNSTEQENITSYAFILWRIVNQNETFIWETQIINQTSVNVTQNLSQWRLLIWCPFNFTASVSLDLGDKIRVVSPLKPLGSETQSTNHTNLDLSLEGSFVQGIVVGGGGVTILVFLFVFVSKRKKNSNFNSK